MLPVAPRYVACGATKRKYRPTSCPLPVTVAPDITGALLDFRVRELGRYLASNCSISDCATAPKNHVSTDSASGPVTNVLFPVAFHAGRRPILTGRSHRRIHDANGKQSKQNVFRSIHRR